MQTMKLIKSLTVFFMMLFMSCSRDDKIDLTDSAEKVEIVSNVENHQSNRVKWGKNEEKYIASMKQHAALLKRFSNPARMEEPETIEDCNCNPSVYSFFDDPDNLIVEGSYVSYVSNTQETQMTTCPELLSAIQTARTYLNDEGYDDIVNGIDTPSESYKLVHAANTLMDLKAQVANSGSTAEVKLANCVLQAIGYTAISSLVAEWATASRYAILRAVGKLATRYIGWVGAAIAVVSFTDCMWG